MTHHHAIYTDSLTKGTIGSHLLPIPMNWKILIQPNEIKTQTAGGILLPDKVKENEQFLTAHGVVCAIGELAYRDRNTGQKWKQDKTPQISDIVTYGKYAGQKIVVQNVRFILLNDDEITSIIPKGVEITAYI
jgi:co-chaperonin GroES (HSP10)